MINYFKKTRSEISHFKAATVFTEEEADNFIHNIHYRTWASSQSADVRNKVIRICGRSLDEKIHFLYATEAYDATDSIINTCPTLNKDIIVYRAGKIGQKSRRYVSASLLREIPGSHSRFVKKILLPQGTRFFPSFAFMPESAVDSELEIIIDNRYIKKHLWGYVYCKK